MKHYCLNCGQELSETQLICPKCGHCSWIDSISEGEKKMSAVLIAEQLQANTQWEKYRCGRESTTGHGFAAEDANALNDIFQGCCVDLSGRNNSKYGPDRIANNQPIQTKYYNTARNSVNAAFDPDGMYAYKGQILEVPKDQYEQAVDIMKEKINDGKINGITNSDEAYKIVRRGSVTYQQAKNIAKAGNIDSLAFDIKTQSITAFSAFGISFAINVGIMLLFPKEKNQTVNDIFQYAFLSGLHNGTITMASGLLTTQVIKTEFGRNFASCVQWGTKNGVDCVYKYDLGKNLINKLSSSLFNKNISGGAAKNASIKYLRTNFIANVALFVITSGPDTWHLINKEMSGQQFIQNLIVRGSSIIGGTLGGVLGAYLGPTGVIGGAIAGGATFDWCSRKIASLIRKDDSEKMYTLIKVAMAKLSNDYMIQSSEEFNRCMVAIKKEGAIDENLIRIMYSIGNNTNDDFLRVEIAYERLQYYFGAIIRQRKTVHLLRNQERLYDSINKLGEDINEDCIQNRNDKQ